MEVLQVAPQVESELLGADELLAGAALRFEIEVPAALIDSARTPAKVRLRPLTVLDLQRITRAARESDQLVAALMVKSAVEAPPLSIAQVQSMSIGLLEFLLAQVNRVSGLALAPAALEQAADAPIARAALVLSQQLGWTPEQIGQLTLGQILLHLQMLQATGGGDA